MKIATLTLNPALDKSTSTERLAPEQKLRCTPMRTDAGGGGINVSKGIRVLGGRSTAVFPCSGPNGSRLLEILTEAGVETAILEGSGETRENIAVIETATNLQYRFTLPGPPLEQREADACLELIRRLRPDILVASEELPPGLPETYYENVAAFAKEIDARLILDTSGPALNAAADEGLFLLKPNRVELSALAGVKELEMNQVDDAARQIIFQGKCEMVIVSLGSQGALLVTRDDLEHIPAPVVAKRSTVGAGDSMVAGIAWALGAGKPPREMARIGVACGTAATMNPGTELFHADDVWRLLRWIDTYGERYRITDF